MQRSQKTSKKKDKVATTTSAARRHSSAGRRRSAPKPKSQTTTAADGALNPDIITNPTRQFSSKSNTSQSTGGRKKKGPQAITLDQFTLTTLPTPKSILIGEQLQDEEDKQLKDAKSPLRGANATGFSFDLPQMSRIHAPTLLNIQSINEQLIKAVGPNQHDILLKTPQELLPNWSKLTKTEQLLLQAGYITLVPGSSNYTYLPLAMRVLDKLTDMINDELVSSGSQKVELPSVVEKDLLDQFQLNRQRQVQQQINAHSDTKSRKRNTNGGTTSEDDGEVTDVVLSQSPYDHQLSPYYRFYNLQDDELVVSPPLLDYYTSLVKSQVKLATQLPLSMYQFQKKLRDINDKNALLNASTNISDANEKIAYLALNQDKDSADQSAKGDEKDGENDQNGQNALQIPHHKSFNSDTKSHQTQTLMNGLITSTEYHAMNTVTFHSDSDDAHSMYKSMLEMFNGLFKKLGVQGVQVEADGGRVGAELSHEYHLIIGATSEAPKLNATEKKAKTKAGQVIQTNTHALVQCGLCNYTANTENAQFAVPEAFDQASYNNKMKTGNLTRAMKQDPRSFGIFESTGGDPQFDREIRSKATGLVKQMLPNLARRDVPMVANVVKLIYAPGQDGFYDIDTNSNDLSKEQLQFINHAVIMLRADREFNPRAIARHFGCYEVDLLSAAESALLLLKFQKFKQKQYQELIRAGSVEAYDPNFNIFSELHNKPLPVSTKDVEGMYDDMNDTTLIEKEQRRLRRLAAKRDVNAGLVIICDNTLAASGIDLDDHDMMDRKFLEEQNKDRSFGLKLSDTGSKNQGQHLVDRLKGYKTASDFQANQHVPAEFAHQFEVIFKGIQEGLISVSKDGDITLNEVPEGMEKKFPEFMTIPSDQSLEQFKKTVLSDPSSAVMDAEVVEDASGQVVNVLRTKPKRHVSREELLAARGEFLEEGIDLDDISDLESMDITDDSDDDGSGELSGDDEREDDLGYEGEVLPILQDEDAKFKSHSDIFESAMQRSKENRKTRFERHHTNKTDGNDDEDESHDHSHDHDHDRGDDHASEFAAAKKQHMEKQAAAMAEEYTKNQKKQKLQRVEDENSPEDDKINMWTNEHGDLVDENGDILPHITSDLPDTPEVRRAFGKRGYDQLGDDDEFADTQTAVQEQVLSTVNPSQGDFTAPQTGDKCIQAACQAQGMLEGLRSIEIGKLFFLADSITRNTDAVVVSTKLDQKTGKQTPKTGPIHMTSAKIGVTRLMHALVESGRFDEHGLNWPELIAPYQISIIADPSIPVNFSRTSKKLIDPKGRSVVKQVDVFENYVHQAELAQEEYLSSIEEQRQRLKKLKATPGLTPSLDKQRNLLIEDAEDIMDQNFQGNSRLEFGHWGWGLSDNHTHALNIAATVARAVPTLEDDIIYDDRHNMSINQRIQDSFAMGIPWVIVIDEMMQEQGFVKVVNRATKFVENLSVDQVVHFFNGQRPAHQRLEHKGTDFEREMKYKVENALLSHFGKNAAHRGDSQFFKIQTSSEPFDYNTHVDVHTRNDDSNNADNNTPRFDEDGNVVNLPDSLKGETAASLKARDEATKLGDVSQESLDNAAKQDKSQLLDDTVEDAIRSLNESNAKEGGTESSEPKSDEPKKKGRAVDEWYHQVKKLRRKLPPPTADELDRMFRVGILYKDTNGTVQLNALRANSNMHVIYGVDPHVVDQYERGNLLNLDQTGAGVKQVIDKKEYYEQQRKFTAQRIEDQLKSGFFDLSLTPVARQEQNQAHNDYFDWQTKQQNKLAETSVFNQVDYSNDQRQYLSNMSTTRRENLKKDGVVFRSIKDGSAVLHRPFAEPEAKPFDVRYDTIDPSKKDTNPLTPSPQQTKRGYQEPPRVDVQAVPSRGKKSLSAIFDAAPTQAPRSGEMYDQVFGANTHIKDTYGDDAYNKIFGNKNAK